MTNAIPLLLLTSFALVGCMQNRETESLGVDPTSYSVSRHLRPPTPFALTAGETAEAKVSLTWKDVSGESSYHLYRREATSAFRLLATLPADTLTYLDDSAQAGTEYFYAISALNGDSASPSSEEVRVVTNGKPSAPVKFAAMLLSPTLLELSWKDTSEIEEGFVIEVEAGKSRRQIVVAPQSGGLVTVNVSVQSEEMTHSFRVFSFSSKGTSLPSPTISVVTGSLLPSPPQEVTVTKSADGHFALTWVNPNSETHGIEIQRRAEGQDFELVTTLPGDAVSFLDVHSSKGDNYKDRKDTYRVRFLNRMGSSELVDAK